MPCDSSHMSATTKETELSKVACLLDELDGKPIVRSYWSGYHPSIYNRPASSERADEMVAELCSRLQVVDVTTFSLELQMWWRDHQAIDKARIEHEMARQKSDEERQAALAKLTDYERRLLGLYGKSDMEVAS